MKKIIENLILLVAVIVFCYAAFHLGKYAWQTYQTNKIASELSDMVKEPDKITVDGDESTAETEDPSIAMHEKYGDLYDRNNDFIGWLKVDGTHIDYPVMFTPDEGQHYLRKNFDETYDIAGTLFADERSSFDPMSTNITIYGHHMKNGTMFGDLMNYKDTDFCKEHTTVQFDTLYAPGTYEIFAVILAKAYYSNETSVFQYYDFVQASTEEEMNDYLSNIQALSIYYDESMAPTFGDTLITLSTCEYSQTNGRLALIAKRVK